MLNITFYQSGDSLNFSGGRRDHHWQLNKRKKCVCACEHESLEGVGEISTPTHRQLEIECSHCSSGESRDLCLICFALFTNMCALEIHSALCD